MTPRLPYRTALPPRSMGANVWHPTSATPIPAPFRENTLKSFQRAVACGASFLEFDVQVTKDGEGGAGGLPDCMRWLLPLPPPPPLLLLSTDACC